MIKKLSINERIILIFISILFVVSLIIGFSVNARSTMPVIAEAFRYLFIGSFGVVIWKTIAIIGIISIIFCIMIYWTINMLNLKYYSLGPIYLILFILIFLLANSYYNIFLESDSYFISLLVLMGGLFIAAAHSFVLYLIYLKKLDKN